MNSITVFDMKNSLKVKTENDLPPHITFDQFKIIYDNLIGLDQIMWGLLWETGGRISAVLSTRWKDINISKKQMTLLVQKKKKHTTIQIPLSNAMVNEIRNYSMHVKPSDEDYLFTTEHYNRQKSKSGRLSRQGAYLKIKEWGNKYIGFNIHPHMLRHGLAIYLLSNNIPLQVIAARLGHSNVFITQKSYLVITADVQRDMMKNILMR